MLTKFGWKRVSKQRAVPWQFYVSSQRVAVFWRNQGEDFPAESVSFGIEIVFLVYVYW